MMACPLLGHRPAFHADTTGFLLRLAREQGDVARFRLGRRKAILLSHPEHVRAVLIDHAGSFTKGRLMQRARRLMGEGLLTSEGSTHHAQRRRAQQAFARERLFQYAEQIPAILARRTAAWRDGAHVRVDAAMDELSMGVVASALLGVSIERDAPQLVGALRQLSRWAPLLLLPGGRALEGIQLGRLRRLRDALEAVEPVVDRDQVMTVFLAGHDTTAAALTWIWLLLATHPDAEIRLHRELDAVLGTRAPGATDLPCLRYTEMVIKEALRLYPPVGRIGRRPVHDVDLGDGVVLPRDAAVFLSPFVTQRDPRWFAQPDDFRPERWADPAADRPRFAWFPFGVGPRSCIGEHFARLVLMLAVAAIAQGWRLGGPTRLPKARSLLTLKPRGAVWMVARRRRV